MEEKIYRKQVSKQALSARIIDAQMPDNQFNIDETKELLTLNHEVSFHQLFNLQLRPKFTYMTYHTISMKDMFRFSIPSL
jgi:hypothetical protein